MQFKQTCLQQHCFASTSPYTFVVWTFTLCHLKTRVVNQPTMLENDTCIGLLLFVVYSMSIVIDFIRIVVMLVSYCLSNGKRHRFMAITIGIIMCIGSTVLSLSFHFQDVLIAWTTTTPLYASKIAFVLWDSDFH